MNVNLRAKLSKTTLKYIEDKWMRLAWRNESQKEQISQKKEAEKAMRNVEVTVSFDEWSVSIGEESYTEWKEGWKNLEKILPGG